MNLPTQAICFPSDAASCLPIATRSILSPSMTTVAFGKTLPSAGSITVPPTSDIRSARSAAVKSESASYERNSKFHARDSSTSARNDKRLFFRFRHGFLGRLKTDLWNGCRRKTVSQSMRRSGKAPCVFRLDTCFHRRRSTRLRRSRCRGHA